MAAILGFPPQHRYSTSFTVSGLFAVRHVWRKNDLVSHPILNSPLFNRKY